MGISVKASDLLVKSLENEKVEYIFGIPGEENLDFLESLRNSESIKLIVTRNSYSPILSFHLNNRAKRNFFLVTIRAIIASNVLFFNRNKCEKSVPQ